MIPKKYWLVLGCALLMGCQRIPLTPPEAQGQQAQRQQAQTAQTWLAMSRNALSITGDIVLTSSQITFQNGESLDLRMLEKNDQLDLVLYQVISRTTPTLLYGNTLCASTPIDYLTVRTNHTRTGLDEMSLTVYRDPGILSIQDLLGRDQTHTDHFRCGIYHYVVTPDSGVSAPPPPRAFTAK